MSYSKSILDEYNLPNLAKSAKTGAKTAVYAAVLYAVISYFIPELRNLNAKTALVLLNSINKVV